MNKRCTLKAIRILTRQFSSDSPEIFDRAIKRNQRQRAALFRNRIEYEYLRDEVAWRLVDRLEDIHRKFPTALDLGCGSGHLYRAICKDDDNFGLQEMIQCDISENFLLQAQALKVEKNAPETSYIAVDEEFLPFKQEQFDLIMSSLSLHWVNDLPSTFSQIKNCLKPDGVFLGAVLGGNTLQELRSAFILADQERLGGISPHISPFMNIADAGNLLSSAGFTLCTVDADCIQVGYPSALSLMEHLQGMGENNASIVRGRFNRDSMLAAASIYQTMYELEDGVVPATFQVIYMIGWAPHISQQTPLPRGSAQKSLKDLASS